MTQSLQSILSEREKELKEKFGDLYATGWNGEKCPCNNAMLSFHAETARLVWEAVEKKPISVIVDLFEIKSKLIRPMKFGEEQDIQEVFKYNFFDAVIAKLVDKYKISSEEIIDELRDRDITALRETN